MPQYILFMYHANYAVLLLLLLLLLLYKKVIHANYLYIVQRLPTLTPELLPLFI